MAADETAHDGNGPATVHREMLRHARANCRRLLDGLHRDALHLQGHRRSALVPEDVLAEGRTLYANTSAVTEALMRQLKQALNDEPSTFPPPTGSQ